jgi:hypothetical protein
VVALNYDLPKFGHKLFADVRMKLDITHRTDYHDLHISVTPHLGVTEGLCRTIRHLGSGIIADNLSKAGWSWGCVSAIDSQGRTIWIADAHRGDGKRFVVPADEADGVYGTGKRRLKGRAG